MNYASRLSEADCRHLEALRGRELVGVSTDGWAAELTTPHGTLRFEPAAMRTPDREHPLAEVVRPQVLAIATPTLSPRMREVASDLGLVRRIVLHRTVVRFSPPRKVARTEIAGIAVPAGLAYDPLFERPGRAGAGSEAAAVVDLDLGIEIGTADHRVLLYSDGTGLFLSLRIDGSPCPGQERRDDLVKQTVASELEAGVAR